jgi:hypothetical protein
VARLAQPMDVIVRPEETELAAYEEAPSQISPDQRRGDDPCGGLNLKLLVGAEGLEPPTPSL